MKVAYIAGPYRAENPWEVERNIRRAEELAFRVACQGVMPLCPHALTRFFDGTITDVFWLKGTTELLRRCDSVVLTDGWEDSSGVRDEIDVAAELVMPVFESETEWIKFVRWSQR